MPQYCLLFLVDMDRSFGPWHCVIDWGCHKGKLLVFVYLSCIWTPYETFLVVTLFQLVLLMGIFAPFLSSDALQFGSVSSLRSGFFSFLFIFIKWILPYCLLSQILFYFIFINFYWSVVALQYCVSFYCTAKQISYMYTYIPYFLDFLPI